MKCFDILTLSQFHGQPKQLVRGYPMSNSEYPMGGELKFEYKLEF